MQEGNSPSFAPKCPESTVESRCMRLSRGVSGRFVGWVEGLRSGVWRQGDPVNPYEPKPFGVMVKILGIWQNGRKIS